ncbi:sensor domain-containing diguanylate cyclase [Halomonas mongoliensis]|uniref:sensor domain-containing diguanylate cyclase n=1 Tax=Halomonas mongoliensis TaxID=321265 RepID=UPI00403B15A5
MLPESFFSSLVERVDDVVWVVGCPDFRLEYLNPAAAAVFGRPVRAFEEDSGLWLAIVHPEDRDAIAASHECLLQEGEVERRYRTLRPDGKTVWIHDRAWLMRGGDGAPQRLFGIARDVTMDMAKQQRLHSTLQLHRRFIDSTPDPIFVVDVAPDGTFVFRYNNPAHRQQTGISLEMIRHRTPDALLDPCQAAAVKAHYSECVRLKRPIQYEEHLDLPAGARHWQTLLVPVDNAAGSIIELVGIARDITPLKQAERQSRDAFETLDQLLQASPVVIYECLPTPELIPSYVSPGATCLFGYGRDELLGRPVWQAMIHPDDVAQALDRVDALFAGEGPIQLNYRLRHRDGHYLQVQSEKRLIHDAAGHPHKVVGVILDVTGTHRLNQRLEKLSQQLPGFIYQYLLSPDGTGRFLYASRRSLGIYGATPEALAISDADALGVIHPDDMVRVEASIVESADTLNRWHCEYRVRHPEGQELWVEGLATPERLEDGSVLWHGYITDVSERKRLQLELEASEARFRRLATLDMLTGAPNRRCFIDCLEGELERMKRHGGEACLVMFDADHFKRINDSYGHAAGDQVLKALVQVGEQRLRGSDVLGRLGGEEFAILMPETDYPGGLVLAERFRGAVADLMVEAGESVIRVTVSLGVVALRVQDSPDSALERADRMLYRAKALGRNRTCGERDGASESQGPV